MTDLRQLQIDELQYLKCKWDVEIHETMDKIRIAENKLQRKINKWEDDLTQYEEIKAHYEKCIDDLVALFEEEAHQERIQIQEELILRVKEELELLNMSMPDKFIACLMLEMVEIGILKKAVDMKSSWVIEVEMEMGSRLN